MSAAPQHKTLRSLRDAGASSVEYIGAILLTALVVGIIAISVPGARLGEAIQYAVCQLVTLGKGPCGAVDNMADPMKPKDCTTTASTHTSLVEVGVYIVDVGGEASLAKSVKNTGKTEVVISNGGELGVGIGLGAKYKAKAEKAGAEIDGSVSLSGSRNRVFTFDSEKDADEWIEAFKREHSTSLARTAANKAINFFTGKKPTRVEDITVNPRLDANGNLQNPYSGWTADAELSVEAKANVDLRQAIDFIRNRKSGKKAGSGGKDASNPGTDYLKALNNYIKASGAKSITVSYDNRTGQTTIKLHGKISAKAGHPQIGKPQEGKSGFINTTETGVGSKSTTTFVLDEHFRPISMELAAENVVNRKKEKGLERKFKEKFDKLKSTNSDDISVSRKVHRKIDINDPVRRDQLMAALLHPLGMTAAASGAYTGESQAALSEAISAIREKALGDDGYTPVSFLDAWLYYGEHDFNKYYRDNAKAGRNTYLTTEADDTFGGGIKALGKLNGSYGEQFSTKEILSSEYMSSPDSSGKRRWVTDDDCV